MSNIFSIVGDSNVRRHFNKTSQRASASIKAAQFIPCGNLGVFKEALLSKRDESNVCIISCLTNFFTAIEGASNVSSRIEPVLLEAHALISEACAQHDQCHFMLAAPMYRSIPSWYREGLPAILTAFSQTFSSGRPSNLHLLPSFINLEYESDNVHLTSFAGLEFMLHLFDSSESIIMSLGSTPEVVLLKQCDSTRVLEDRVLVLEQDSRRVNQIIEEKAAIDSEMSDFRQNERDEDCFIIEGLPLIPSEIVGKEWQELAVSHVKGVITPLMGRDLPIVVVQNVTGRHKGAPVKYSVKMATIADSDAIRKKFGAFFFNGGGKDSLPTEYKGISIRNRVTPETKIRITILQLLAKRYKDSNPGSKVKVIGFAPRPLIKIIPAASASDRRVKVFNFIEAVKSLPTNFTEAEAETVYRSVNAKFEGKLRSLFIVLSDDVFRKRLLRASRNESRSQEAGGSGPSGASDSVKNDGAKNSSKSGKGSKSSGSGRKSEKRGASASPSERAAKK